jgi:RNA polymerase sigma-70 factor (ECF subfamily)
VTNEHGPHPEDAARDDEDARLLAAGEYGELFAAYYPIILQRLRVRRLPQDEAEEVRQRVVEHLLAELRAGKRYDVPFRRVLHQRTTWKLYDYYRERRRLPGELPENLDSEARDTIQDVESDIEFDRLMAGLPPREKQVIELRWRQGLDVPDVAQALGIDANAVHQALHRAHAKLRKAHG